MKISTFFKNMSMVVGLLALTGFAQATTITHTFTATSGDIDSNISFTTEKNSASSAPAFNASSAELRIYYSSNGDGGSVTLHAANGAVISAVKLTASSAAYTPTVKYSVDEGGSETASLSEVTYTISGVAAASSLKIQNGNTSNTQLRVKTIEVTYSTDAPTSVYAPTITVDGQEKAADTYWNSAQVTLSTITSGASVYYTLNGDAPTTSSTLYSAPFTLSATANLRVIAVKSGLDNSAEVQKLITIVAPVTATLPYNETFEGSLGDFYPYSVTGDQIWIASTYSSGTYTEFAKMSGYSNGNLDNEDWLISPKFVPTGAEGLKLTFASATGYAGDALKLKYSTNYSGFGDPTAATWTEITDAAWPAENSSFAWMESGDVIVAGTSPVHFAFVYTSNTTAASTWEIANVSVVDYSAPVGPTIVVKDLEVPEMGAVVGTSDTTIISVSGVNLTADITLAVSGKNADRFAVLPTSLTQTGGTVAETDVKIVYTPAAEAKDSAVLTISSTGAEPVVLQLSGFGIQLEGLGTEVSPFTVADVKELNNSFASATKYWVQGYIVGVPSGGNAEGNLTTVDLEAPFTGATAIALAGAAAETDLTTMIGVQLPTGDVRTALNLVDNVGNLGKKVMVYGTLEAYFTAAPGVKNVTEYKLDPNADNPANADKLNVYASAGKLYVSAVSPENVVIYNVLGKQLYSNKLREGLNTFDVNTKGLLIVKVGGKTFKVVI